MTHAQIIAGAAIQLGSFMVEAGIKRVVPELSKIIDYPELEKIITDIKLDQVVAETVTNITKRK